MNKSYRVILMVFIFMSVILLILYLWREYDDISNLKKINFEKFSSFFDGVALLATLASIYFVFDQILDARTASIPDLFPSNTTLIVTERPISRKVHLTVHNDILVKEPTQIIAKAELHNVGQGVAKYVNVKWQFDAERVRDIVTRHYELTTDETYRQNDILFISKENLVHIDIPEFYMHCYGPALIDSALEYSTPAAPKPPLSLEVSYQDSRNRKYIKYFDVRLNAFKSLLTDSKSIVSLNFKERITTQ